MTVSHPQLARLCALSYSDQPTNVPYEQRLSVGHTQALMSKVDADIVIAIRGSDQIYDWITNADIRYEPFGTGRAHHGFCSAAKSIYDGVAHYIRHIRDPETRIYFTGHSLGGAIAVMLSVLIDAEVVTIGCPRVGDSRFVAGLRHVTQYVNPADKVPHLPFFFHGFRHATAPQINSEDGSPIDLDKMAAPDFLEPHSVNGYAEAMGRLTLVEVEQ